jgi:hypothetical protein
VNTARALEFQEYTKLWKGLQSLLRTVFQNTKLPGKQIIILTTAMGEIGFPSLGTKSEANTMERVKLKTTKYYRIPAGCHAMWTEEQYEKLAFYRTEPKKIKGMGYVWRAWERNAKGEVLYMRAEKCED